MAFLSNRIAYPFSFNYPCPRKLRQVVKMSMLEREPSHQITEIWKEYHKERPANIAGSLEKHQYTFLLDRYLFTLSFEQIEKSSDVYLSHLSERRSLQNTHTVARQLFRNDFIIQLCTSVDDFKRYGNKSHPYLVFTLRNELLFSKGISLARGDIVNNMLTKLESQQLWEMIKSAYQEESRFELVDNFNNHAEMFDEKKYNDMYNI